MVQSIIDLDEKQDRILNIVKAQHGFKNKSQALALILKVYGDSFLEPELRPEFVEKILNLEKNGKFYHYEDFDELEKELKNA